MTKTIEFEKSLKRLENIVQELEQGDLQLEQALKKYEEGIELARVCSKTLKEAKLRVEKLVKKEDILTTEQLPPGEGITKKNPSGI